MRRAEANRMRCLAALAVVTFTTPAWAESEAPPSYTLHVVAADATAVGLMAAGALTDHTMADDSNVPAAFVWAGLGTYVLGAPVVHLMRDQNDRAALSVTLRMGLPLAFGTLGYVTSEGCEGWFCQLDAMALGALGGAALASIIDYAVLSWGTTLAKPRKREGAVWSPTVAPAPGGGQVGVAGTF